ncbi:MAG: type I-E CRISPR-associated protein Cas5/CasD [Acidobacteriota bacterium]|nr:type I-E CRISPR-associated protein Cas5/CasD [Acidobacteriota bacterium]
MTTLLLRLAGPLQSWGDSSRFTLRGTRREPTKSGVVGLLAAALGRQRGEAIDDLARLRMAVRTDQPGSLLEDFQTAEDAKGRKMPLTRRLYLADAVFTVAIEGEQDFLRTLSEALSSPVFPPYLGRRSCPPNTPIVIGMSELGAKEALAPLNTSWQASSWFKKRRGTLGYQADLVFEVDASIEPEPGHILETVRDVPLSFDREHRKYGWRTVARTSVSMLDPKHAPHDPFSILEA